MQKEKVFGMLPKVMLICIDCPEEKVKERVRETNYENLEIESVCLEREGLKGVLQIILKTQCPYICFCENDKISNPGKIGRMVDYMERHQEYQSVFCMNLYMDEDGVVGPHVHGGWIQYILQQGYSDGITLCYFALRSEINLLGNLENYIIRREAYINKAFLLDGIKINKAEAKMILLLENIYGMKVGIMPEVFVGCQEKKLDLVKLYENYSWYQDLRNKIMGYIGISDYPVRELPSVHRKMMEKQLDRRSMVPEVRKQITFFYTDMGEYHNLEPIGEEALRGGYQVEFTEEIEKSAEIGIYCSHVNIIKNRGNQAKFSVIMLHDMTQWETDWPNLWNYEQWESFDIGILPGNDWAKRWQRCSGFYYAYPKLGVYELGYPKGDRIHTAEFKQQVQKFRENLGLKYQYSILYAPSWENNGKEDDFVRAVQGLEVNLLIKQAHWNESYLNIIKNIQEMRRMHEGKYENLYYIEPEEDIFTALATCDLVVSDESSVMTEALLFGKPSIAVMDWIIPEEIPRCAEVPYDYVYKCKKAELGDYAAEILDRIKAGEKIDKADDIFSNIGKCASDIMDLIEYYTGEREKCGCLDKEVYPNYMLHGLWDA